jgi:O-antigen/teichoic acid export membrane protein
MTAQTILNKIATTLAGLVLARLLSPAEYGIAFFVVNVVVFVFIFPTFVMGDVLLAERRRFNEVVGAANVVMWIAAAVMFAVLAGAAIPIERYDGRSGVALLVLVAATRPIADAVLAIANARMRMDLEYRRIAIIDGSVMFAATLGCLAMAYFGSGPLSLNVPPIAALAVRGLLYWRVVRRRVDLHVDRAEIRPIARRFMTAGLGQYINNILLALEIVVLGFATDEAEVGLYVLAATYAIQANNVIAGQIGSVLQPIFAHVQDDPARQVGGFLRATRLLSAIAVPLSLVQAAVAIPLFHLLFPPKWTGSIAIFAILSVAQAFVFVSAPSIALLKAQGRFHAFLKLQWAQLVTASIGFFLAVMYGGPMALRAASSIGLPVDENAGKALALGFASAAVWALFCPLAVWIGGRPARLGKREATRVFLEPWLVTLPICALLVAAWAGMRAIASSTVADVSTLAVLAPLAAVASIAGCVWTRESTRADILVILDRFRKRRSPASP